MILKWSSTLPLFYHPLLTVLNFVQKDRNALLILPLFVKPICDFTPNLTSVSPWLLKYIWHNLQLFQFRFDVEKIFKFSAAPWQYFDNIMTTIWSTYKTHDNNHGETCPYHISKSPIHHVNISTEATSLHHVTMSTKATSLHHGNMSTKATSLHHMNMCTKTTSISFKDHLET